MPGSPGAKNMAFAFELIPSDEKSFELRDLAPLFCIAGLYSAISQLCFLSDHTEIHQLGRFFSFDVNRLEHFKIKFGFAEFISISTDVILFLSCRLQPLRIYRVTHDRVIKL